MCLPQQKPPPLPPPPAAAPTIVDREVQGAHDREKKRQRMAAGRGSTIATSGAGVQAPANTGKTILGG